MKTLSSFDDLRRAVAATKPKAHRRMVALSGGPGSGKTTLAKALADALGAAEGAAAVLPMDGFHLDNRVLEPRGLLPRKGAPETFDVAGFAAILARATQPGDLVHPLFDRTTDCAIAGAAVIPETCRTVIVEGNYLMLQAPGWEELAGLWDISVALHPGMDRLRERLVSRWRDIGLNEAEIIARVDGNDLPNARLITESSAASDYVFQGVADPG